VNHYADSDEEEARMYDSGAFDRLGVAEAKGLKKRVRIVKGPEAGKTGTIGEVRRGAYKGAPKTFTVDIDGGGSIQLPKEALRLLKDQSVAEGSLNELSKNTLKSYSRERGTTIHQDQRDADRARDTAADKKKHGNTRAAADWEDEASWLDKRAEKGAKGVAQAAIKIAKKGMAEAAKKGLYYYVNRRKAAGTSRDKNDPRAPSAQDWRNAAKTAKKENVELDEKWSQKYKSSIDCSHPRGFSQRAHCAGKNEDQDMVEGETKYDAAWDEKVRRLGQMAKQGERKTVWDPVRRVYKTVPVNTAKTVKPTQENIFSLTEKNSTTQTAQSVNEDSNSGAAEQAILNRIMTAHIDLLRQFGPEKVMQAAEEVAYNVGDLAEIGTSDVSGWVRQVRQILGA
jgi:hypothetical protein